VADTEITPEKCKGGGNLCDNEVFYGFFFGKVNSMRNNKGFTLIELMVVILIVAILAAVLAPMMTGRIRQAKWSEGKSGAGTLATGIRALMAELGNSSTAWLDQIPGGALDGATDPTAFEVIGATEADLRGKYFAVKDYAISGVAWNAGLQRLDYTITVTAPGCVGGGDWTLDGNGDWAYTP